MKQQQTGIEDALLDLEELKQKLVKDLEHKEHEYTEYRRLSKKRFVGTDTDKSVPTSVRKRRRGEGGISASMSQISAMSDNLSYDDGAIDN
jgi:hypothetical protein